MQNGKARFEYERILKTSDVCTTLLVGDTTSRARYILKRYQSPSAGHPELACLSRLPPHPNIVSLIDSYTDGNGRLCIVLEWCEGGDLAQLLGERKRLGDKAIRGLFLQLLGALEHVHSHAILHRDLKPRNIFIAATSNNNGSGNDAPQVKVGDFGASKITQEGLAETALGTPYYLAPEIVQGRAYSRSADIWSLGCVMHEMCTGRPPFPGRTLRELLVAIVKSEPAEINGHGPDITSAIKECLRKDPEQRPTAAVLLQRFSSQREPRGRFGSKEECVKALLQKFGQETAMDIIQCLRKESVDDRYKEMLNGPRKTVERREMLPMLYKWRAQLGKAMDEALLEQCMRLIEDKAEEAAIVKLIGDDRHERFLSDGTYQLMKDVCDLEGQLLNNAY